jgi:hypothetical protein
VELKGEDAAGAAGRREKVEGRREKRCRVEKVRGEEGNWGNL